MTDWLLDGVLGLLVLASGATACQLLARQSDEEDGDD